MNHNDLLALRGEPGAASAARPCGRRRQRPGPLVPFPRAILVLLGAAGLMTLSGCKTQYGPSFDPYQPAPALSGVAAPVQEPNLEVAENVFVPVSPTNRMQKEWLAPPAQTFQLGPGDRIEIELLDQAGSRAGATVGPDGKIYYNILPGVFVWGLTLAQTKELLAREFTQYLRDAPEVSIRLQGVGSRRVWVLGNVQTPGVYSLAAPATILGTLAAAGGPVGIGGGTQTLTDLRNSFVLRNGSLLQVDFDRLIREGDLSQNIYLQPDDFVYLRPSVGRNVYVMGAVARPAEQPYHDTTTLVSALAGAGGIIQHAYGSQVAIVRGTISRPSIALVNYRSILGGKSPDVPLQEGDIVFVPFSPFRRLALLGEQILDQFVRTIAINEGSRAVSPDATPIGPSVPLNFNFFP